MRGEQGDMASSMPDGGDDTVIYRMTVDLNMLESDSLTHGNCDWDTTWRVGGLQDNPERVTASMNAVSPGSRIRHYVSLIASAQAAYSEYLEKSRELDQI